jgi:hypothetical protein
VRRRYVVLGLLTLVVFVLLFALAGPASASADKRVYFTETSIMWPVSTTGHPEDPTSWIGSKSWTGPTGVLHVRGFLMEGPMTIVPPAGYQLDFPAVSYALYDSVSINGGNTSEKMTSYAGAASADDVAAGNYSGVWKISAASHLAEDGITALYTCEAHGVAGVVEGYVMHFQCQVVPKSEAEWYISLGTGSGFFITK